MGLDTNSTPESWQNIIHILLYNRTFPPHLWWSLLEAAELLLAGAVLSPAQLILEGSLLLHQFLLRDLSLSTITPCCKGSLERYNHLSSSVSFFMQTWNLNFPDARNCADGKIGRFGTREDKFNQLVARLKSVVIGTRHTTCKN